MSSNWQDHGACRKADPEIFFPSRGEDVGPARAICMGCDVFDLCFQAGLYERFGIWAGTPERERRQLRRNRGIVLIDDAVTYDPVTAFGPHPSPVDDHDTFYEETA